MDEKEKAETKAATEAAVREGQKELASFAKGLLRRADDHPIGHMGCEYLRAKVQKRSVDLPEMFREAPQIQAIFDMFLTPGSK